MSEVFFKKFHTREAKKWLSREFLTKNKNKNKIKEEIAGTLTKPYILKMHHCFLNFCEISLNWSQDLH